MLSNYRLKSLWMVRCYLKVSNPKTHESHETLRTIKVNSLSFLKEKSNYRKVAFRNERKMTRNLSVRDKQAISE